jgi:hypothetical protein
VALGPLKDGDMRQNIVIRPGDLILVRPIQDPATATTARIDSLRRAMAEVDQKVSELSRSLGPQNAQIIRLRRQRELMQETIDEIADSPTTQQTIGGKSGDDAPATQPSSDLLILESRRLFADALQAEHKQDYPTAIKDYEEIKRLDPHFRIPDQVLDARLKYARNQLP